jgi:hypothetical protein
MNDYTTEEIQIIDVERWIEFAHHVSDPILKKFNININSYFTGSQEYITSKILKKEAIKLLYPTSNNIIGISGFSKKNNTITFWGIIDDYKNEIACILLLENTISQLDKSKDISINIVSGDMPYLNKERDFFIKNGFKKFDQEIIENSAPATIYKLYPI